MPCECYNFKIPNVKMKRLGFNFWEVSLVLFARNKSGKQIKKKNIYFDEYPMRPI